MKKLFSIIVICILLSGMSGCKNSGSIYSNYREVEHLQLIRSIGIDNDPDGNVRLSISSGKGAEDNSSVLMSRSGPSIATAIDSLQDYASSQELFYAHTKFFLIGQDAAEGGIGEYLGYIERSTAMPMGINLFVARGSTAEGLMTGSGDSAYDISETLSSVERVVDRRGDSHVFSCADTARSLSEYGAALICAVSAEPLEGSVFSDDASVTAVPDGFGILKDGRLVDFIDADDAIAACLFIDAGLTTLTIPDGSGGKATLTLEKSDVDLVPVWGSSGNLEYVDVNVSLGAEIVEMSQYHDATDQDFLDYLGSILAGEIRGRFDAVLDKEKELDADFLGLGGKIRDYDSKRFDLMSPSWHDRLPDLEFRVSVEARVGRTSDLRSSVSIDGKGAYGVAD